MRAAGERLLSRHPHFHSVNGTAEATTLPSASVDFITAGQAFHWFDSAKARLEFARILCSLGWVVLIWNERLEATSLFASAYELLLRNYGTDYGTVDHRRINEQTLRGFFGGDFVPAFSRIVSTSTWPVCRGGSCPLPTCPTRAIRATSRCWRSSIVF